MSQDEQVKVAVVMGSDSDWPVMKECVDLLFEWGINCQVKISSAHRSPELTVEFVRQAQSGSIRVIIAAAGMAAHLAGIIAAHTSLPVIGVPMASGALQGIDSLLSTVQMPPGIPVATMGIGPAGARNAAVFAARILALSDPELGQKLEEYQKQLTDSVRRKDAKLQNELSERYDK